MTFQIRLIEEKCGNLIKSIRYKRNLVNFCEQRRGAASVLPHQRRFNCVFMVIQSRRIYSDWKIYATVPRTGRAPVAE